MNISTSTPTAPKAESATPTSTLGADRARVEIMGLGTSLPKHEMLQDDALAMFSEIVCEDERQRRLAKMLFKKTGIVRRHTVVPYQVAYNWCGDRADESDKRRDLAIPSTIKPSVTPGASPGPTTGERMALYARFASPLACRSAELALAASGVERRAITHLVTVTCTGFDAPGVDLELIHQLGMSPTVQRINVGFMGCHGAINGLRAALAIARSDSEARVLLCAVELCSLHFRFQWDPEGVIGNALFADGSASVVLGQVAEPARTGPQATPANAPGPVVELASESESESGIRSAASDAWQVVETGSMVIPESREAMSWGVGNFGFDMKLTSEVGEKINAHLRSWLTQWLAAYDLTLADIDHWGVHPGGPKILDAVDGSLDLPVDALSTSRHVLKQHGNMSSPTVLFILDAFTRQLASVKRRSSDDVSNGVGGQHCLLLAFGPGLVAEVALLRRDSENS